MRKPVEEKTKKLNVPEAKVFILSADAPTKGDFKREDHKLLQMGVAAGGAWWSGKLNQMAYNLVQEFNEFEEYEASRQKIMHEKLNRMLRAFGLPEQKEGEEIDDAILRSQIGKFCETKESRDALREKIKAIRKNQAKKKLEILKPLDIEQKDKIVFEEYKKRETREKRLKDFKQVLLLCLAEFAGEKEESVALSPENFLIRYYQELGFTPDVMEKSNSTYLSCLSQEKNLLQKDVIDLFVSIIKFPAQKLGDNRLSFHQNSIAPQVEFFTEKLFGGLGGEMTVEKYNQLKQEITAAVKKKDWMRAAMVVAQQQCSKDRSGDAWISGLTNELRPFAFIADGCFQSDDHTGDVLRHFVAPLVPQIVSFLHEIAFIKAQGWEGDEEKYEKNLAALVKNFVFHAVGAQSEVFYNTNQRFNLAGFVEYIGNNKQPKRFWLGLGDVAMLSLSRSSEAAAGAWDKYRPIWSSLKDAKGGPGVYLPINEGFKSSERSWAQEVEDSSGAGIDVLSSDDKPGQEMIMLMTDGFFQDFPGTSRKKSDISLELSIDSSLAFSLSSIADSKSEGDSIKEIQENTRLFREEKEKVIKVLLPLQASFNRYAGIFNQLQGLSNSPLSEDDKQNLKVLLVELKQFNSFLEEAKIEQTAELSPEWINTIIEEFNTLMAGEILDNNIQPLKNKVKALKNWCVEKMTTIQMQIEKMTIGDDALCGYVTRLSSEEREKLSQLEDYRTLKKEKIVRVEKSGSQSVSLKKYADALRTGNLPKDSKIKEEELTVRQFYLWEQMKINSTILQIVKSQEDIGVLMEKTEKTIQAFFSFVNLVQHNLEKIDQEDQIISKAAVKTLAFNINLLLTHIYPRENQLAFALGERHQNFKAIVAVFQAWKKTNGEIIRYLHPEELNIQAKIEKARLESPGIVDLTAVIKKISQSSKKDPQPPSSIFRALSFS